MFGVAFVSVCLTIAIVAHNVSVQNTKTTVAKLMPKHLTSSLVNSRRGQKIHSNVKKKIENYLRFLHCGQCFLKKYISVITFWDLANLRNPFIVGGNATLIALVVAKATYGIAKAMGSRRECFEFRSGATKDDNFLLFLPEDTRGIVVLILNLGWVQVDCATLRLK